MTMNKWTVGLAAAGLLGLSSVAQAQVATKLATTSLSGYVSTAYNWIPGDTSISTGYNSFGNSAKTDRFALDVVSLSIGSPVAPAATGWAASRAAEAVAASISLDIVEPLQVGAACARCCKA